jgi:hypothetical protein
MDNNYSQFASDFVGFLGSKLPDDLPPDQTLQRAHIMVYALATKLSSLLGRRLTIVEIAGQGGGGGGGPHRIDLLVKYAADASSEVLSITKRSLPERQAA